jgi:hypothetical protein
MLRFAWGGPIGGEPVGKYSISKVRSRRIRQAKYKARLKRKVAAAKKS